MDQIALVTGANRGLGLETCRQLAKKGISVILTSRDPRKGREAQEKLRKENLETDFHQCDVTNEKSIEKLKIFVETKYKKLDILINNAGILIDRRSFFETDFDIFRKTMETNFFGPLRICRSLVPLMFPHNYGRIVNVSSGLGQLKYMGNAHPAYSMSKAAVNAITKIIAAELKGMNIKINSLCPGWVRTDMGGPQADRSVEKGVETIIWLALLPDNGPTGKFFRDKKEIPW